MPSFRASRSTGDGTSSKPRRPPGLAARVYTAAILRPLPASSSKVGTAKSGVPMKTRRSGMSDLLAVIVVTHSRPKDGVASLAYALFRRALAALLERLGELLDDAVALQFGNLVD